MYDWAPPFRKVDAITELTEMVIKSPTAPFVDNIDIYIYLSTLSTNGAMGALGSEFTVLFRNLIEF